MKRYKRRTLFNCLGVHECLKFSSHDIYIYLSGVYIDCMIVIVTK